MRSISLLVACLSAVPALLFAAPNDTPATHPTPAVAKPPPNSRVIRDIDYAGDGQERHRLDLYLPDHAAGKPLPVLLWVHGGGWTNGDKANNVSPLPLLAKGYAVVSANYRFSQQAIFPAQIHDCKAAVRWVRAHAADYNLDPDHIAAWGASSGGHLVALLGLTAGNEDLEGSVGPNVKSSSAVQCVVDECGPTDFLTCGPWDTRTALLGGDAHAVPDQARRASPINYVSKDAPPFIILHGDSDPRVPIQQSQSLHDALQHAGVESTFLILPNTKHGGPAFHDKARMTQIEAFLAKHLR